MLDNNFVVKYITSRSCFLVLSEINFRKLSYQKIIKLIYESKEIYCSCVQGSEISDNNHIGIPSLYAKALGILEHQSIFISDVLRLPTLSKIMISPVSSDDYEILDISSDTVQTTLLDQIRVVNKKQKITVWISKWLHVTVKIEDAEPMPFGCLANLTEVHIIPPHITKPSITNSITSSSSRNSYSESTTSSEVVTTSTDNSEQKYEDCAELRRLKKYLNIKKPVVFRVTSLKYNQNLTKSDIILNYPFNVFIFKKDCPKFINSDSYKEVLLCKISRIDAPVDFRESKDENVAIKPDLIVRICIVEDYYSTFSDDAKSNFKEYLISDKFPNVFIPETTITLFDLKVGSKIILGNNFNFHSDVRSIEIVTTDKKNTQNIVQRFKTFVADHVKYSKCILNSETFIEIENNLVCLLKFNPPSEFCVFDEYSLRNCKFYGNTDKHIEYLKNEIYFKLVDLNDVCLDICGFKNIAQQAQSLLTLNNCNENVLIVGKSGTGKSTITKYIAQKLSESPYFINIVFISCKKLKGKSVENLHKYFSQDFQNMIYFQPSILILDDLHILCGKNEGPGDIQTQDALYSNRVSEMLSELIETHQKINRISVIASTESTSKLNDNILSSRGKHLFRNIFTICELDKKQREFILQKLFVKKAEIDKEIDLDDYAVKTEGYVVQDLVDFVNKSVFESCKRNAVHLDEQKAIVVKNCDLEATLKNNVAIALRNVKLHSPGDKNFNDVGGLDEVKKLLVECMNWPSLYPDLFNDAPLRLQSGILLYGPPGVGKTLLVGAAAKQCNLRLISVKGPELLSKYIGASEQAVRNIFEKAQSARPCILFFDEFDSLAPKRGHDSTGVTDRVVNQLLTQLDGVESLHGVFVIAATSRPDLLDPALLRPGRLDQQVMCPVPDQNARLSILKALSRSLRFENDVNLVKTAENTSAFSGADLQAILYTAQLYAVEDAFRDKIDIDSLGVTISNQHLEDALKGTSPSLSKQEINKYNKIYARFQNKKHEVDESIKQQKATLA